MSDVRIVKSAVWCAGDVAAWAVAETPSEVADKVRAAIKGEEPFVELTLANPSNEWNGRTAYISPRSITQIAPPMAGMYDEDDE